MECCRDLSSLGQRPSMPPMSPLRFSISEMGAAEAQEDRPLRMLALVASRDIEDEEVRLGYPYALLHSMC